MENVIKSKNKDSSLVVLSSIKPFSTLVSTTTLIYILYEFSMF